VASCRRALSGTVSRLKFDGGFHGSPAAIQGTNAKPLFISLHPYLTVYVSSLETEYSRIVFVGGDSLEHA